MGSPLDGRTARVAQNQDQRCLQRASTKLQAAHYTAFCMRETVAHISQHEKVARHRIENRFQSSSGVSTADNGRVRCLANGRQSLSHLPVKLAGQGVAMGEALVALLHDLERCLRSHRWVLRRPHECTAQSQVHGGRQRGLGAGKESSVLRGSAQELHLARLKVVDAALQINFAAAHGIAKRLTELQKEVHGLEDIHLHGVRRDLLHGGILPQLCCRHFRHAGEVGQEPFQGTSWRSLLTFGILHRQVCLRGTDDGTALRVAEHHNQARAQLAGAELQAANHGTFGVGASVARIAENEYLTWHGIEDCLNRCPGVGTADDCSVRRLS
mmetsp:Transcript_16016/g.37837  ORF Transcript_16016/g.37837 Transcript_16016/m.37837 type:complete len:327 (+) Transcript_16016:673-1653(+)